MLYIFIFYTFYIKFYTDPIKTKFVMKKKEKKLKFFLFLRKIGEFVAALDDHKFFVRIRNGVEIIIVMN